MADTDTAAEALEAKAAADEQQRVQDVLDLERAGLSKDEDDQVTVMLADHLADGTLTEEEIFEAKADSQAAEDALESARETRHEQAEAVESGDFAQAEALSHDAEYDLALANDHGAEASHPTIDAQQDRQYDETQALESARAEEATAAVYAEDAAAHAAVGDYAHADQSAAIASSHADSAVVHADAGDAGGSYATASTTDVAADTTTE
jgi:hypothetical protein